MTPRSVVTQLWWASRWFHICHLERQINIGKVTVTFINTVFLSPVIKHTCQMTGNLCSKQKIYLDSEYSSTLKSHWLSYNWAWFFPSGTLWGRFKGIKVRNGSQSLSPTCICLTGVVPLWIKYPSKAHVLKVLSWDAGAAGVMKPLIFVV